MLRLSASGSVEIVVCRIRNFDLSAAMTFVAFTRRLAALGVDTLNGRHAAKDPISGMAGGGEQQPGNRTLLRGIDPACHLSHYLAAIVVLPGGAGVVCADFFPAGISQFRLRAF